MPENKKRHIAAGGAGLPVLVSCAAVLASVLASFLVFSHYKVVYDTASELHENHYRMLNAVSGIIVLNSRLTMTASQASSTGGSGYAAEHDRLAAELDADIKKFNNLTGRPEGSEYIREINETNLRLGDLEQRALRLARAGRKAEALGVLNGSEYLALEKKYAGGVNALLSECEGALEADRAVSARLIFRKGVAAVLAVAAALLLWTMALVSGIRWIRVRGSTEALVAEKEAEFKHFFDTVQEIFYRADWKGRLTDITPSIWKYAGYNREELLGRPIAALYQDPADRAVLLKELLSKGMVEDYEIRLKTKDRRVLNVLLNARLLRGLGGMPSGVEGSLRDITARKTVEDRLRRVNRLYAILSGVNEAIAHISEPQKLYEEVCRIAVENGGMKFAWVGLAGPGGSVIPVASFGEDHGYLKAVLVSTDSAVLEGLGPSGTAAREGTVVINDDTARNLAMLPWRTAALERGFLSSAALPLGGGGAVTFYAPETGYFTPDEEKMLFSLSEAVTYAVTSMTKNKAGGEVPRRP
jgi:PAS domain S-box-containing protein